MSTLDRLWVGMLTRDKKNAGTGDPLVLIINDDGVDLLHHTFLDTTQRDQERGEANVYEVLNMPLFTIHPQRLTNSSIRVAIRGGNAWHPEYFFVWGQTDGDDGTIVPLAIETSGLDWISTDLIDGNCSSFPVRRTFPGDSEMQIQRLLMLMTTANEKYAGTESPVELQISGSEGAVLVDYEIPETSQLDQEQAQANFYFVPVNFSFTKGSLDRNSIRLRIRGNDKWLPASFYLFGLNEERARPTQMVPLVHLPEWNYGWLSREEHEGRPTVTLPLVP